MHIRHRGGCVRMGGVYSSRPVSIARVLAIDIPSGWSSAALTPPRIFKLSGLTTDERGEDCTDQRDRKNVLFTRERRE